MLAKRKPLEAGILFMLFAVILISGCSNESAKNKRSSQQNEYLSMLKNDDSIIDVAKLYGFSLVDNFTLPALTDDMDRKGYALLAGIYIDSSSTISKDNLGSFMNENFSWGEDYALGRYSITIDYNNGKWIIGDNGEAEEFALGSIEDTIIEIDRGESVVPQKAIIDITSDGVRIADREYVRISGPNSPMTLLKKLLKQKKYELLAIDNGFIASSLAKKEMNGIEQTVMDALVMNDINTLKENISSAYGLAFGLEEKPFVGNLDTKDFIDRVSFQSECLSPYKKTIKGLSPIINNFLYTDIKTVLARYPSSYVVEYRLSPYDYYVLIFVSEKGKIRLAAIDNRIELE